MSQAQPFLGLGNQLNPDTEILHTTISGKKSLGRITDLLMSWLLKKHPLNPQQQANLRVLAQTLLEFSISDEKVGSGYFEFAHENGEAHLSVRIPPPIQDLKTTEGIDAFEKEITQFWMKSASTSLIRKNLGAHDRVEIRYHSGLNLTEWKVIHVIDVHADVATLSGFSVYLDSSEKINSTHSKMADMGDVPYENLLSEVYRSGMSQAKRVSGDLNFKGQSLQGEDEVARIAFENEVNEIESDVSFQDEESSTESNQQADAYLEELVNRLRGEQVEIKGQAKEAIKEAKQKELYAHRKVLTLEQKIKKFEDLLKRKESINARSQNQIKILNEKVQELGKKASNEGAIKVFRDKALEMHAMLKKVVEEKVALEKALKESQRSVEASAESEDSSKQPLLQNSLQLDELTKKAERLQRALEAEKVKVKQLSERVTVAERESQEAVPMVEDLERKVEQAIKVSQQHKKETEAVKLKVVQAEQEKNKIQNELIKAQAQIATLQKRQAA